MSFTRLLNAPINILKDFVQLMRLELAPDRNMKWSMQLCLTIPPAAPPIAPSGMSSIVMIKNKMLFFLQLSRLVPGEPSHIAVPVVYDLSANVMQVADKRLEAPGAQPNAPVTLINAMLRRFAEFAPPNECCIYPSIREILTSLTIPPQWRIHHAGLSRTKKENENGMHTCTGKGNPNVTINFMFWVHTFNKTRCYVDVLSLFPCLLALQGGFWPASIGCCGSHVANTAIRWVFFQRLLNILKDRDFL